MEMMEKNSYIDSPIDRLFIWFFSRKMANVLDKDTRLQGYEGLVDLSQQIMRGRDAQGQQAAISSMLRSLIPGYVLAMIRTLFSPTKLVCELNAWFATKLFEWLVGPCEVSEAEVVAPDGQLRTQRSGIHIKKCRYLEQSGCVGMCINMCKLPTQDFFATEFGFPLTLTPNFEDLSCEMVFGQVAPPLETEPAYTQPCLANQCSMAKPGSQSCPKVRE